MSNERTKRVYNCYTYDHVRQYLKRRYVDADSANHLVSQFTNTYNEGLPIEELQVRFEKWVNKNHNKPKYNRDLFLPN